MGQDRPGEPTPFDEMFGPVNNFSDFLAKIGVQPGDTPPSNTPKLQPESTEVKENNLSLKYAHLFIVNTFNVFQPEGTNPRELVEALPQMLARFKQIESQIKQQKGVAAEELKAIDDLTLRQTAKQARGEAEDAQRKVGGLVPGMEGFEQARVESDKLTVIADLLKDAAENEEKEHH